MSSKSVVFKGFWSRKKPTRLRDKLQFSRKAAEEVGTAFFNPRPPTSSGSVACYHAESEIDEWVIIPRISGGLCQRAQLRGHCQDLHGGTVRRKLFSLKKPDNSRGVVPLADCPDLGDGFENSELCQQP